MRRLALILVFACAVPSLAQARTKRAKLAYAVLECAAWPWTGDTSAGSKLWQMRRTVKGEDLFVIMKVLAKTLLGAVQARYLGTNGGLKVWSIRGPSDLGDALKSAGCTVTDYKDVLALPAARRDWIKARSTCLGSGTRRGRAVTTWRCDDTGVTVTRVGGVAPTVLYGSTAFSAAGLEPAR